MTDTNNPVSIGRLAMRAEEDWWTAYYAMPDTMDNALPLARIHMSAIRDNQERASAFIDVLRGFVGDMIEHQTGTRPEWPNDPKPAPEHERDHHHHFAEESIEALTARADGNGQSCVEFAKALREIMDVSLDPVVLQIADDALHMVWLKGCLPSEVQ